MTEYTATSPLTQRELIEGWFMDHRVQVLDLAAYLDRLERARELDAEGDFRMRSVRAAIAILVDGRGDRVRRVQLAFSDPDTTLLASLDRKNAFGAHDSEA